MPEHIADSREAEEQLAGFLAKYDDRVQELARKLRRRMKRRLPQMLELVYDNYNFLVIVLWSDRTAVGGDLLAGDGAAMGHALLH